MARAIKRMIDFTVSVTALVVLAAPMTMIALAIFIADRRPILFRQLRPGYKARPFTLFKFRTMAEMRDQEGHALADSRRLTRLGGLLRSLSLDELPQLWNVLVGDMSLVGPRPLLMQYLDRYTAEQARRHDVPPGITGWAQVNGRNALNWPQRLALDVWYVDHWSLALDARVMTKTVLQVLRREGISQAGQATMTEFMGNESASGS